MKINFGDIVIELTQYGGFEAEVNFIVPYEFLKEADPRVVADTAAWFLEWYSFIKPITNAYWEMTNDTSDEDLELWAKSGALPAQINHIASFALREQRERKERARQWKLEQQAKEKTPSFGFVYLAYSETGQHKIGSSKNPEQRVNLFDVQMPVVVKVVHLIEADNRFKAEKRLHKIFKEKRVTGEWFDLTEVDVAYIQSISSFADGRFVTA